VVKWCNNIVSYEFLWIRRKCDDLVEPYYYMLFRVRVRIRFSAWLVSGDELVFILLSVVIITLPVGQALLFGRNVN